MRRENGGLGNFYEEKKGANEMQNRFKTILTSSNLGVKIKRVTLSRGKESSAEIQGEPQRDTILFRQSCSFCNSSELLSYCLKERQQEVSVGVRP